MANEELAELIADRLAKKLIGDESSGNKAMNDAIRRVLLHGVACTHADVRGRPSDNPGMSR